jgi:hypothetical protein
VSGIDLRELEAAATPGPWRGEVVGSEGAMVYPPRSMRGWVARVTNRTFAEDQANAALIAAARNALPLLLDVVDAADGAMRIVCQIPGAFPDEDSYDHVPDEKVSVTLRRDRVAARRLEAALAALATQLSEAPA